MKRILVHIPVTPYGEYDIFTKHDNKAFITSVKTLNAASCPNMGNRLWFQGIVSAIDCEENSLEYWSPLMSKDYINNNFDLIVAPMANVFAANFTNLMETLAERFEGIKVPIYVIACGIQASCYEELDDICRLLKEPASKFISSVYDTGGEFALRGYFTKEFFDRLGYPTAVVTGCPSLYQLGRNLQIGDEKVTKETFVPVVNGSPQNYRDIMLDYPNAVFIDQEVFWREILDASYFEEDISDDKYLDRLIRSYGYETTRLLLEDRIKLFPDMNTWRTFIRENKFSCSFGSRIHGSIMPILSGIPAILECRDARTREMAEFFNIPFVLPTGASQSLYDIYLDASYTSFNCKFPERFDYYESFLTKCGIVDRVNCDNRFFNNPDVSYEMQENQAKRMELKNSLSDKDLLWRGYSRLLMVKRKLASIMKR